MQKQTITTVRYTKTLGDSALYGGADLEYERRRKLLEALELVGIDAVLSDPEDKGDYYEQKWTVTSGSAA